MKRYSSFLGWLGIPPWLHSDYPPGECCKVVSEFALEYRTTRERVIQVRTTLRKGHVISMAL